MRFVGRTGSSAVGMPAQRGPVKARRRSNVVVKTIRDDVCSLLVARDRFTCTQPVYLRRPTVSSLKDTFKFVVYSRNLILHLSGSKYSGPSKLRESLVPTLGLICNFFSFLSADVRTSTSARHLP